MRLKATYTPTPLYVNTPHAISEAYRMGLRYYSRAEWDGVKLSMAQVATLQPDAADVVYYIGEASRFQKNYAEALSFYNQAISINANFAPAYLGRARVRLITAPEAHEQPLADLQAAIQKDPQLAEAYIILASILVDEGKHQEALDQLALGEAVVANSPQVALYRAVAFLKVGQPEEALQQARLANQLDITLLPVYRVLAEAYLANQQTAPALEALDTYLAYTKDDADAYVMQALAYEKSGDAAKALKAYDLALSINKNLPIVYANRGQLHFLREEYDLAQADFEAVWSKDKRNYPASMMLGKTFYKTGSYGNAYNQFEISNGLAETAQQKAEVLYWRAQSLEVLNYMEAALRDYKALMLLKTDVADAEWIAFASTKAVSLVTPTRTPVTPTATKTRVPSATVTPSRTPTATAKKTSTPTSTPKP